MQSLVNCLTRVTALAAVALSVSTSSAWAQAAWPARPVRIVVAAGAGGSLDQVTRKLAQRLSDQTGQNFYVENKAGGSSLIGVAHVAQSKPDGYTLMADGSSYTLMPYVFKSLPWDYERDLVPVSVFNIAPVALAVSADSKVKTLKDLVALARANPGRLTFGTGGTGTFPNFAAQAFRLAANFEALQVPFKGGAEATLAMLAGTIDFQLVSTPGIMAQVKGGKVRLLAVTGDKRLNTLPDVPTFGELGYPQYKVVNFTGLWVPKGVPPDVMERLKKEVALAAASPDFQAYAREVTTSAASIEGEALIRMLSETSLLWSKVAVAAGVEKQ